MALFTDEEFGPDGQRRTMRTREALPSVPADEIERLRARLWQLLDDPLPPPWAKVLARYLLAMSSDVRGAEAPGTDEAR